jgi:hypothetical protein
MTGLEAILPYLPLLLMTGGSLLKGLWSDNDQQQGSPMYGYPGPQQQISPMYGQQGVPQQGGQEQGGIMFGQPGAEMRFQRFAPEQQAAQLQLLQSGLGGLQQQQQPLSFDPYEQRARTQFQQQTIPGLAERFAATMGEGTRLGSSAFGQAIGGAGAQLEEGLGVGRAQFDLGQRQHQQQAFMNMLNLGLTPQFESAYRPRTPGLFETGAQAFAGALPHAIAYGLSGLRSKQEG